MWEVVLFLPGVHKPAFGDSTASGLDRQSMGTMTSALPSGSCGRSPSTFMAATDAAGTSLSDDVTSHVPSTSNGAHCPSQLGERSALRRGESLDVTGDYFARAVRAGGVDDLAHVLGAHPCPSQCRHGNGTRDFGSSCSDSWSMVQPALARRARPRGAARVLRMDAGDRSEGANGS